MTQAKKDTIFQPRLIKEDDMYGKEGYVLNLIRPNVYQFESRGAGCHVYLIIGENLNVLIDTGVVSKFNSFNYLLTTEVGLKMEDIDLVINTHEHFDHISANAYFHCVMAAHRWAAVKIENSDELITKGKKWGIDLADLRVNIWLEDRNILDLGNVFLKTIQTPGHTSGCICLYEPYQHYLFSGDTLFKGWISNIYESGSISEHINSLQILNTLKINAFYPSHGKWAVGEDEVKKEIAFSIEKAKQNLQDFIDRVKSKPSGDFGRPPPSLYNREEEDL
jgi:glyoxylase-like metal-dependent hydrolase (beta-lactamase superfamily II)